VPSPRSNGVSRSRSATARRSIVGSRVIIRELPACGDGSGAARILGVGRRLRFTGDAARARARTARCEARH
jgi:hypothetical protein